MQENNDNEFNLCLQAFVNEDNKKKEEMNRLRNEFGIEDGKTVGVIVKKENTLTSLYKIINNLFRFVFNLIFILFSFVGIFTFLLRPLRESFILSFLMIIKDIFYH